MPLGSCLRVCGVCVKPMTLTRQDRLDKDGSVWCVRMPIASRSIFPESFDFTPFAELAHFDVGLTLQNVLASPERASRMHRAAQ
jgi:hypothetical protein